MARLDSDLIGLPIVSMEDASVVSEVDALVIDDATLTVAGFLANLGLYEATVLPYQAARAVGADAIIVRSAVVLAPLSSNPTLAALAEKGIEIGGARVVTLNGKEVGSAGGFYVDDRGHVVGLEFVAGGREAEDDEPPLIPISMVHRVGPELVVLKQEYAEYLVNDPAALDRPAPKAPPAPVTAAPSTPPAKPPRVRAKKPPADSTITPEPSAQSGTQVAPATPTPPPEPSLSAAEPLMAVEPPPPSAKPRAASAKSKATPAEETGPARHFLVGRRVTRRIEDAAGEIVAEEGDIVTEEMIQRAREREQLLILSLNVE